MVIELNDIDYEMMQTEEFLFVCSSDEKEARIRALQKELREAGCQTIVKYMFWPRTQQVFYTPAFARLNERGEWVN